MATAMLRNRSPLTTFGKLSLAAMVGLVLIMGYSQMAQLPLISPLSIIFLVCALICAGIVITGWRWAPLVGAFLSGSIMFGGAQRHLHSLSQPELLESFIVTVFRLGISTIGLVAGIGVILEYYRRSPTGTQGIPRWLASTLTGVAGLCLGAILVATSAPARAASGVDTRVLNTLPALTSPGFTFEPATLRVRVGETVGLRLENPDQIVHNFDIDEYNVHVPMPVGGTTLAIFRPNAPGTYQFYCGVPGHRELGMVGTLTVEP